MAVFLIDGALDALLAYVITNGTQLNICSQLPTTYGNATTKDTYSLGVKTSITIGAAGDKSGGGRESVVPEITDGVVSCTGSVSATHWAITNGSDTLVAAGTLSAPQTVTDGNTFTLAAFAIGIPDAT